MTRQLLILRHAQAVPHVPTEEGDRARPLTATGLEQARSIGRKLAALAPARPMKVLCSPAVRTRQTAQAALEALEAAPAPVFEDGIYHTDPDGLYRLIHGTEDEVQTLLLVGHNPSIGALAMDLVGTAALQHPSFAALQRGYPLAGLTMLGFEGGWLDVRPSTVRAATLLVP
ncbi:SixA phosphatase family protein [Gluconobacter morbifer]|uniref:Phosphohistidine phosphatase n=1 Tax=Gluconobacter morbifer G707 TaxID=1088869 RepID=G6XGU2_9PROT|nr:histidine phosphatase family protein [Gluconobacter morbifer]EHH69400.1 phosphohistidine phosphatase [Gluconobacter morbifer G707]